MNIGRFARWYRPVEYAAFGRALEHQRFAFLPQLACARRVLILGEGDGRTLARLLDLAPAAHFDVVEVSAEMIALAKERVRDSARVTFHCQDARTRAWPAAHYDGIVTHFFLDCFHEEEAHNLIGHLTASLTPHGHLLIAEFSIPDNGWRRLHAKLWIGLMYRFFGIATGLRTTSLPPIGQLMRASGMRCIVREERRAGLITSEVWRHAVVARRQ